MRAYLLAILGVAHLSHASVALNTCQKKSMSKLCPNMVGTQCLTCIRPHRKDVQNAGCSVDDVYHYCKALQGHHCKTRFNLMCGGKTGMPCVQCVEKEMESLDEAGCKAAELKTHCEDLANEAHDDAKYIRERVPKKFHIKNNLLWDKHMHFVPHKRYLNAVKIAYAIASISEADVMIHNRAADTVLHMELWACGEPNLRNYPYRQWGPQDGPQFPACKPNKPHAKLYSYHKGGVMNFKSLDGVGFNVGYQTAFPWLVITTSFTKQHPSDVDRSGFILKTQRVPFVNMFSMMRILPMHDYTLHKEKHHPGTVSLYTYRGTSVVWIYSVLSRMHYHGRSMTVEIFPKGSTKVPCKMRNPHKKCRQYPISSVYPLYDHKFPTYEAAKKLRAAPRHTLDGAKEGRKSDLQVYDASKEAYQLLEEPYRLAPGDVIRVVCLFNQVPHDRPIRPAPDNPEANEVCEANLATYQDCSAGKCDLLRGTHCTQTRC